MACVATPSGFAKPARGPSPAPRGYAGPHNWLVVGSSLFGGCVRLRSRATELPAMGSAAAVNCMCNSGAGSCDASEPPAFSMKGAHAAGNVHQLAHQSEFTRAVKSSRFEIAVVQAIAELCGEVVPHVIGRKQLQVAPATQ